MENLGALQDTQVMRKIKQEVKQTVSADSGAPAPKSPSTYRSFRQVDSGVINMIVSKGNKDGRNIEYHLSQQSQSPIKSTTRSPVGDQRLSSSSVRDMLKQSRARTDHLIPRQPKLNSFGGVIIPQESLEASAECNLHETRDKDESKESARELDERRLFKLISGQLHEVDEQLATKKAALAVDDTQACAEIL
jgi:hypothetical protein